MIHNRHLSAGVDMFMNGAFPERIEPASGGPPVGAAISGLIPQLLKRTDELAISVVFPVRFRYTVFSGLKIFENQALSSV